MKDWRIADAGPGTDKRGLATLARKMEALAVVLDRDFRLPPGGK